jgi:hypothetical protein
VFLETLKRRLYRFTHLDPEFQAILAKANTERKHQDLRLQKIAKATLDSEDTWVLQLVKQNPNCVLDVIAKCTDPPKDS